jgi:class 3 adenylate cyclase
VAVDGVPETKFALLGADRIAYQVFGEGQIDLVVAGSIGDAIDLRWDLPAYAEFLQRLATRTRVITFDRRGSGSSDNVSGEALPGWERWADEARTVLDAVGSERAVVFGISDSGPAAVLFAASHPARCQGLILASTAALFRPVDAAGLASPWSAKESEEIIAFATRAWGTVGFAEFANPDAARDPAFASWFARSNRLAYNPRDAGTAIGEDARIDVRAVLSSVQVPTLVLHREDCQAMAFENGRYLAEHIAGAQLVAMAGRDAYVFTDPAGTTHIEKFLSSLQSPSESDRALAAILFTDFVGSTKRLSTVGDHAWRNLLDSHDVIARTVVDQHAGRLIDTTGDGILATFDGPGRAIRCAIALRDALRPLGIEIRAGLHTGEVEIRGAGIAGIAVHIASRVCDRAVGGELLVSAAVPMLVAGAGFEFNDRGNHTLKGIDGTWQLFAVRT